MTGAESIVRTLANAGIELCLTNPGTSEMHFVAALDQVGTIRSVLGLFEGVVSGAADGYARMAGKPACTLLHLGPGLGNAFANFHNAWRAGVPVVNVVGEHATHHRRFDAPLTTEIESIARPFSAWVRTAASAEHAALDAAEAVEAARRAPGQIATLILPADVAWGEAPGEAEPARAEAPSTVPAERVARVADILGRGEPAALLLGGAALREAPLRAAGRAATRTKARLFCPTFVSRLERGAGRTRIERLPYFGEQAAEALRGLRHLVLVGAKPPVSFFAYPGKPSWLLPEGCAVHVLAQPGEDAGGALEALAELVNAPRDAAVLERAQRPAPPSGALDMATLGAAVAACLPEHAIVSDESITGGVFAYALTAGAPPHDWLHLMGGAIGQGMPVATGAALACPGRKVLNLQADGSALYTIQSLWTQAREGLDVTTLILDNRSYAILGIELARVGVEAPGPLARSVLDIGRPDIDFVRLAQSLGVPATRAATADELVKQLAEAFATPGPHLIDALLKPAGG